MQYKNIRMIDLNLLKVFYALSVERHVTKAGDSIGLSQPAVSHALNRLRDFFQDELFIRTRNGMEPTARSIALFETVRQVLDELEIAVASEQPFDPATAGGNFRIGMNDLMSVFLLPTLSKRFARQAPSINLRTIHTASIVDGSRPYTNAFVDLDEGRFDLALVQDTEIPTRFTYKKLVTFDFVLVSGLNNSKFQPPIDADTFMDHGHIMVTTADIDYSQMDAALAKLGLERDIKLRVPHYAAAMSVAEETDLIYTLPRLLVPHAEKHYRLKISELPVPSPTREFYQVWLKTKTSDPVHAWVRGIVQECFERAESLNLSIHLNP